MAPRYYTVGVQMQVTKNCGYCNKEFTMTPAVAERREKNSKSGKVFCSQQCGPAYNKIQRQQKKSRVKSTEAQQYLNNFFATTTDNIIGGGLATTDNIIHGVNLNTRMEKDMNTEDLTKALALQAENPDMTIADIIEVLGSVSAKATPIPSAPPPPVVVVAPIVSAPIVSVVPNNAGMFPTSLVPVPAATAGAEQAVTGCDALYWDVQREFKQCAWSSEHNKYSYWVIDVTSVPDYPQGKGYTSTANDCYRCNALGYLTETKLTKNFVYDTKNHKTTAKTVEEYILQKRLDNPLV